MKFTVIISLYNQRKYLPKIVESMAGQIFKDFEVRFCDDGSNDGTKEFFEKELPVMYNHKFKWHYHRLKKNSANLSKNINQGIKAAEGEYCVFIMGDSFPERNYLEILDQWVNPDSLICGVRVNVEGNKIVELDYRLRKRRIPQMPVLLPKNPYWLATGNGLTIPTEAMRKHGGWDERFYVKDGPDGEDNEILARLYYKGYLIWSVPQLILYHYWHKNIVTGRDKLLGKLIKEYAA